MQHFMVFKEFAQMHYFICPQTNLVTQQRRYLYSQFIGGRTEIPKEAKCQSLLATWSWEQGFCPLGFQHTRTQGPNTSPMWLRFPFVSQSCVRHTCELKWGPDAWYTLVLDEDQMLSRLYNFSWHPHNFLLWIVFPAIFSSSHSLFQVINKPKPPTRTLGLESSVSPSVCQGQVICLSLKVFCRYLTKGQNLCWDQECVS